MHRNLDPIYAFPERRLVKHLVHEVALRTSAMRSLGAAANVFAIESFMDELALKAGRDPLEFRRDHLADTRALAVLDALERRCGQGGRRGREAASPMRSTRTPWRGSPSRSSWMSPTTPRSA
ncbi:MAG: molybdopterin-dependent oxidoreductase [Chloroflexi bacterium]|nr:molybdopterin-dependent oxidoreductase [Chloroflexota bacterium]